MQEHDSPTVLAYRVGQLEKSQAERFDKLESKLDHMASNFVTNAQLASMKESADIEHRDMKEKIKSLEDWNTWAVRLVGGAILLSVLGLVLKGNHVF